MTIQMRIKSMFSTLDKGSQQRLLKDLQLNTAYRRPTGRLVRNCPTCESTLIVKNGHRANLQRYKCKNCQRTFTPRSGSRMQGIHRMKKFKACEKLMGEQYVSLKEMEKKLGISHQTAFDWRHKILWSLRASTASFEGVTELDEVGFQFSQKGRKGLKHAKKRGRSKKRIEPEDQVKLLVAADRSSHRDLSVAKIGRIAKVDVQRKLSGKFQKDCTLVTDKHRRLAAFAKSQGINHIDCNNVVETAANKGSKYRIQEVRDLATMLKSMTNYRCKGVSTKYLQSYANWLNYNVLQSGKKKSKLSRYPRPWIIYANIEKIYENFIKKHSAKTYSCPTKKRFKTASNLAFPDEDYF